MYKWEGYTQTCQLLLALVAKAELYKHSEAPHHRWVRGLLTPCGCEGRGQGSMPAELIDLSSSSLPAPDALWKWWAPTWIHRLVTKCRLKQGRGDPSSRVMTLQGEPASTNLSYRCSVSCVLFILSPSSTCLVGTDYTVLSEPDNSTSVGSAYHGTTSLITWVARRSSSNNSSNLLLDVQYELIQKTSCTVYTEKDAAAARSLILLKEGACALLILFSDILDCTHSLAFRSPACREWLNERHVSSFNLLAANVQKLGFSCTYFAWQKR